MARRVIKGRLFKVLNKDRKFGSSQDYYIMHAEDEDGGNERPLAFTEASLKAAEELAARNPEDVPKKSFITDLLD